MPRLRHLATLALAAGLALAGAGALFLLLPGRRLSQPARLIVAPGASHATIARQLADAGVIRGATAFEVWSELHVHTTLKAGPYRFPGHQSLTTVFNMLARGDLDTVTFTVPEGFNRFDIANALGERGLADPGAFLRVTANPALIRDLDPAAVSLEGYLFPATYPITPGTPAANIAAEMVARFRMEARRDLRGGMPPGGIHRWVTIASMVEKETGNPAERPVIAGVFDNRLGRGLALQSDPTVIYAELLGGVYSGALHGGDLAYNSPYNTYRYTGLPPGPIANPGRASLEAAAHPAKTPYMYFVSNGHGSHRFARTLAEQERNIQLYIRARGGQ